MRFDRSIPRVLLVGVFVATSVLVVSTSTANAAPDPAAPSGSTAKQMRLDRSVAGPVADYAAWQRNFEATHPGWGKVSWTVTAPSTAPSTGPAGATVAALSWSCSLYQGPVYLPNGVYGNLQAETDQVCSGSYGVQQTRGKFQRSSWTGYRDYSGLVYGSTTTQGYLTSYFVVPCGGPNQGTYNYRFISQGFNSASGWTTNWATYGGAQSQRFACGT